MAETDERATVVAEAGQEDRAEVGVYATAAAGFEHGLVALAMGQGYWLEPDADGATHRLFVERTAAADVSGQLVKFDRESLGWPPPAAVVDHGPARETEWFTPMLWSSAVAAVFWAQGAWPELTSAGALDGSAVVQRGEWWRIGTALFLHADAGHLVANGLSGLGVFAAMLTVLGVRRGWALLVLASLAANAVVALFNAASGHSSIGASTAIFAALGLLTGRAGRAAWRAGGTAPWRGVVGPLIGGGMMLALFGAGDGHTDVLAHLAGFVAGLGLGAVVAPREASPNRAGRVA